MRLEWSHSSGDSVSRTNSVISRASLLSGILTPARSILVLRSIFTERLLPIDVLRRMEPRLREADVGLRSTVTIKFYVRKHFSADVRENLARLRRAAATRICAWGRTRR